MVHVRKCPLTPGLKRGKPTTEFISNSGRKMTYCRGYIDKMNDEPLPECKECLDWVEGQQATDDYERYIMGVI